MNIDTAREVQEGNYILHKRTDTLYMTLLKGKVKESGIWKESLTYTPVNNVKQQACYTRSLDNFEGFEVWPYD